MLGRSMEPEPKAKPLSRLRREKRIIGILVSQSLKVNA